LPRCGQLKSKVQSVSRSRIKSKIADKRECARSASDRFRNREC
jgi:hypothetical protein